MLLHANNGSTGEDEVSNNNPLPVRIREGYWKDFDLVADLGAIAAGATTYGPYQDGVSWVRQWFAYASVDQSYDLLVRRRDTSLQADLGAAYSTGQTAVTSGNYRVHVCTTGSIYAPLGYSACWGIKNNGASPTTFAKLKVQAFSN